MGNDQSALIKDNDLYKQSIIDQRLNKLFETHKDLQDAHSRDLNKYKTDEQKALEAAELQDKLKFRQYLNESKQKQEKVFGSINSVIKTADDALMAPFRATMKGVNNVTGILTSPLTLIVVGGVVLLIATK